MVASVAPTPYNQNGAKHVESRWLPRLDAGSSPANSTVPIKLLGKGNKQIKKVSCRKDTFFILVHYVYSRCLDKFLALSHVLLFSLKHALPSPSNSLSNAPLPEVVYLFLHEIAFRLLRLE